MDQIQREKVLEKLGKIKALAERGVGGEKETAMRMYEELKRKYDIYPDEAEAALNKLEKRWFSYSTKLEEELLLQIFYKVTGDPVAYHYTGQYSRRKKRGVECTEFEAAEIQLLFNFYRAEMQKELEVFMIAFKNRNDLYPDETARAYKEYDGPERKLTDEEKRKYKKAVLRGIGRRIVYKIRRQTPTECERLDGFPDNWTKYDTKGNEISDTARYTALGNSIAIPCAVRVFQGIVAAETEVKANADNDNQ